HDFAFLADVLEGKPAVPSTAYLSLVKDPPPELHALERRPPSFLRSAAGCLAIAVFIAIPLGVSWIGGSYLVARLVGGRGGMICFFVPVLLMAYFVFTRPSTDGVNQHWTARIPGDAE